MTPTQLPRFGFRLIRALAKTPNVWAIVPRERQPAAMATRLAQHNHYHNTTFGMEQQAAWLILPGDADPLPVHLIRIFQREENS